MLCIKGEVNFICLKTCVFLTSETPVSCRAGKTTDSVKTACPSCE